MLTKRASSYLASLKRNPSLPAQALEDCLREHGIPSFDPWLAFQEQFAGYVEPLGSGDSAIWGILHAAPHWLCPGRAEADRDPHDGVWAATCADVHPSYVYRLEQDGKFFVPPTATFDMNVERNAVVWGFFQEAPSRRALRSELSDKEHRTRLREELDAGKDLRIVSEASDHHIRFYVGKSKVVKEDAESGAIMELWRRA